MHKKRAALLMIVYLCVLIKSRPEEVVVSNSVNDNEYLTSGVVRQVNSYIYQSLSVDTHNDGVTVTASQQDFEVADADVIEKYFELSEYEEYILAKLVECEAGNQNVEAKETVVITVLNRVKSLDFPSTVEEVIKQCDNGVYQFSPLIKGGSYYYTEPSEESYDAVYSIEYGYSDRCLLDCLYFESLSPDEKNWHSNNLDFIVQYDDIRFYK